jgi:hypothetical protein
MNLRKILVLSTLIIFTSSEFSFARDLTVEGKLPSGMESAVAVSAFSSATETSPIFLAQSGNSKKDFSLKVEDKIILGFLDSNSKYVPSIFAIKKGRRFYWASEAIKSKACRQGTARGVTVLKRDLRGAKFGIKKAGREISYAFLVGFTNRTTLSSIFNSSATVKLSKDCDPIMDGGHRDPGMGTPTPIPTATPTSTVSGAPTPTATPTSTATSTPTSTPTGTQNPPQVRTSRVTASGNLDANASGTSLSFGLLPPYSSFAMLNAFAEFQTQINIIDSLGGSHPIKLVFFKVSDFTPTSTVATSWLVRAYVDGSEAIATSPSVAGIPIQLGATGALTFAPDGSRVTPAAGVPVIDNAVLPGGLLWNNGAVSEAIDFVLEPFTSVASNSVILSITQDGNGL